MSKWVVCDVDASTGKPYLWKCDECGEEVTTRWNYCPECGDPKTSKRKSINTLVKALEAEHKKLREMQSKVGTNLAEVGTRAVKGYQIDADALMEKVAEEYGERARDTLYRIIRYMPPAQPKTGKWKNIVEGIEYACGTCDTCGVRIPMAYKYYEYCPHCGMKNEVEHDE